MATMKQDPVEDSPREIDVLALMARLWGGRRLILKCCAVALAAGVVIAFSIPKEYTTGITIAPESSGQAGTSGSLSSLASIAGFNLGGAGPRDALNPELYPDIVSSTPFLLDLFPLRLADRAGRETSLYQYLDGRLRVPWWSAVVSAPFKALGWFVSLFKKEMPGNRTEEIDPFRLSKEQAQVTELLRKRLMVSVDRKSGTARLAVTMQDPVVSAVVADRVLGKLKAYMIDYRTSKARQDLHYTEQLFREAKQDYYQAQQKYAGAMDRNQNLVLRSASAELERLQNEMTLAYGVYNQTAQQLAIARAKVQEITPVFTVVEPATVPLKASSPQKVVILIAMLFLGGAVGCCLVLFRESLSPFFAVFRRQQSGKTDTAE